MARSPPEENHCVWAQLSNTFSNATEVGKWATPSCSRPQPATNNAARVNPIDWLLPLTLYGAVLPKRHFQSNPWPSAFLATALPFLLLGYIFILIE